MRTMEVKVISILWPRIGTDNPNNWYRLECQADFGSIVCTGYIGVALNRGDFAGTYHIDLGPDWSVQIRKQG